MKIRTTLFIEMNVHKDTAEEIQNNQECKLPLATEITEDMIKIIEDSIIAKAEGLKVKGKTKFID